MRLARVRTADGAARVAAIEDDAAVPLPTGETLADLLHANDPAERMAALRRAADERLAVADVTFLPPVDRQEVWAAGVTYNRSKMARMAESELSASVYDRVYVAERPELFFKATARRVVGSGAAIRVRRDSRWSVPEPELALMIRPDGRLAGYTIGDDVSARDIEGDNPLYLPQAKMYDQSCALGPTVLLADSLPPLAELVLTMTIRRERETAFQASIGVDQMRRHPMDLVTWLFRDNSFPDGVVLLTGTGIVPGDAFTLEPGDEVSIELPGVGTLVNHVVREVAP